MIPSEVGRVDKQPLSCELKERQVRSCMKPVFAQTLCSSDSCYFNPLYAELKPSCHLLALVGARHIVHTKHFNDVWCE